MIALYPEARLKNKRDQRTFAFPDYFLLCDQPTRYVSLHPVCRGEKIDKEHISNSVSPDGNLRVDTWHSTPHQPLYTIYWFLAKLYISYCIKTIFKNWVN